MNSVEFARVLVVLEGQEADLVPEYAVQLALHRGLQVVGLFVEDSDLLSSAGLPFTREIGAETGRIRPLSRGAVEQAMRDDAERLRLGLQRLARERGLDAVFETGRGQRKHTVLRRTRSGDLLVLRRTPGARRAADMLDPLLREAPCTVMVFGVGDTRRAVRAAVLVDGGESGARVLDRALETAGAARGQLTLLVAPGEAAVRAAERAAHEAASRGVPCLQIRLPGLEAAHILRALSAEPPPVLFLGRDSPLLAAAAGGWITELAGLPLVIVP